MAIEIKNNISFSINSFEKLYEKYKEEHKLIIIKAHEFASKTIESLKELGEKWSFCNITLPRSDYLFVSHVISKIEYVFYPCLYSVRNQTMYRAVQIDDTLIVRLVPFDSTLPSGHDDNCGCRICECY
jgi:hypothetical protein